MLAPPVFETRFRLRFVLYYFLFDQSPFKSDPMGPMRVVKIYCWTTPPPKSFVFSLEGSRTGFSF